MLLRSVISQSATTESVDPERSYHMAGMLPKVGTLSLAWARHSLICWWRQLWLPHKHMPHENGLRMFSFSGLVFNSLCMCLLQRVSKFQFWFIARVVYAMSVAPLLRSRSFTDFRLGCSSWENLTVEVWPGTHIHACSIEVRLYVSRLRWATCTAAAGMKHTTS